MTALQLVAFGTFGLLAFLGGLVLGFVYECAAIRTAERDLCTPLPEDVTR